MIAVTRMWRLLRKYVETISKKIPAQNCLTLAFKVLTEIEENINDPKCLRFQLHTASVRARVGLIGTRRVRFCPTSGEVLTGTKGLKLLCIRRWLKCRYRPRRRIGSINLPFISAQPTYHLQRSAQGGNGALYTVHCCTVAFNHVMQTCYNATATLCICLSVCPSVCYSRAFRPLV